MDNKNELNEIDKKSKKKEKREKTFSSAEVIVLSIMTLLIGLGVGSLMRKNIILSKGEIIADKHLNKFIENYEYIIDNYYEDVDKEKLIKSAINGMMESLDDPYSIYFDESEASNFNITLDGSYKGLGVQIFKDTETGNMVIQSVFENSPASKAGLKEGDQITSLDGESVKDMPSSDFSSKVRNSTETSFKLEILRGDKKLNITINKELVTLNSVTSEIIEKDGKKIGYIYIGIFANNTTLQFKDELNKLEKEKIDALIIDVRSNTGGHLTTVDSMLDIFLNSKQIKYMFEQSGKRTVVYAKGKDNKNYPIVLLGNELSASASEVLIAGLKENIGATFIGKKTFGKGTVQELVTLDKDTQYKITVKKWLTPKGNWVNDTEGIIPDIEADLGEKYIETKSKEDDNQLNTAINYILEKTK